MVTQVMVFLNRLPLEHSVKCTPLFLCFFSWPALLPVPFTQFCVCWTRGPEFWDGHPQTVLGSRGLQPAGKRIHNTSHVSSRDPQDPFNLPPE